MNGGLDPGAAPGGRGSHFWPALVAFGLLTCAGITEAPAQEIVRRVGRVTFRVDASQAFPGGVVVVRLGSRGRLGAAWALLDGRRGAFYSDRGVPRALVPVAASAEAGPATLGVAIAARRGEQRVSIPITIASRDYQPRYVFLSEDERARLGRPEAAHDGRRLLAVLRTESPKPAPGLLLPPVDATGSGFGEPRTYTGAADVESRIDALSGETVVIDHGQGVLSVLQHLSRVDARTGDPVPAAAVVGLSGDTGLAPAPMLQWRVYLHGVAVDPTVLGPLL